MAALLGLVGVGCAAAASAPGAPVPIVFRLTLSGTAHHQWAFTSAPVQTGSCSRTVMSEGIRTVRFRTTRPTLVRLSAGRVLTTDVRGIAGTVTLGGANTTDERCEGVGSTQISDCVQTRRAFSGARARISSPRRGIVALGRARLVRLARADCPLEPVEVRQRPLGPVLAALRMPVAVSAGGNVARFTMRATRSQTTNYVPPESGTLKERVEWRLTFVRVNS